MNMNKLKIVSLAALGLVLFASCTKDPETEPRELITSDLVWDAGDVNAVYAQQFLNGVYNYIPTGFNRIGGDFLDAASGDAIPTRINTTVEYYTNGLVSSIQNPDAYWNNTYYGIRQANIFLANIGKVPTTAANLAKWRGEVRFIRALLYFELLKRYGGVPLVGDKIFTLDDNLSLARNTFDEVVTYIVAECDAVKVDLPADPAADTDFGHATKGAPIALKCRVYLYAASPLFNGSGTAGTLKTKGITGYATADPARWQKALDAAIEFRAITYYALQSSFTGLFTNKKNAEVIFAKQSVNNFDIENNNAPVGYINAGTQSGGRTSPTQNLVDAFAMTNGLAITDPASGYDPNNPYVNRDSRLNATVFYTGVRWLSRNVETFEGGLDKPNNVTVQTRTGYYLRKYMFDFSTSTSYSTQSHNFIVFRFAEILLNQAEAQNELGDVEGAVQQIILLRKRAGIAAGTAVRYGIKAGITQAEMRDLIRTERRVELAFEEHRFWDIRRWKMANTEVNGPLYGLKITRTGTAPLTYTYQRFVAANAVFSDKLYLMPLPFDETTKNAALEQNPGW